MVFRKFFNQIKFLFNFQKLYIRDLQKLREKNQLLERRIMYLGMKITSHSKHLHHGGK